MMIDNLLNKYINESIYTDVTKERSPWVIVDRQGKVISNITIKDYNRAHKEWKQHGKDSYIINVELSTNKFLAMIFFPKTQKQPEPNFKYEKMADIGFTGHWELVKDMGKGAGKEGVY